MIKNGIPFDVAWSMNDIEVLAYCVVFGQLEGNEFDWNTLRWKKKDF